MTSVNQNVGLVATDPVFPGVTIRLQVTVTGSDGSAVDLTGVTTMDYKVFGVSPEKDPFALAVIEKDLTDGVTVTDASGGIFQVLLAADDTSPLWPGTYYHQVITEDSAGLTYKTMSGSLLLSARF